MKAIMPQAQFDALLDSEQSNTITPKDLISLNAERALRAEDIADTAAKDITADMSGMKDKSDVPPTKTVLPAQGTFLGTIADVIEPNVKGTDLKADFVLVVFNDSLGKERIFVVNRDRYEANPARFALDNTLACNYEHRITSGPGATHWVDTTSGEIKAHTGKGGDFLGNVNRASKRQVEEMESLLSVNDLKNHDTAMSKIAEYGENKVLADNATTLFAALLSRKR